MPASFDIGGNTGSAQELRKKFTSGDFLRNLGGDRKERDRYTNALTHRESGGRYGRAFDPPTAESPGGPNTGATDTVQVQQVVQGPVGTTTIDPAAEIRAENQRQNNKRIEDERRAREEDEARKSRDAEAAARDDEAAAAVRESLAAANAARAKDAMERTANLATEQAAGNTTVANDIVANTRATSAPETDEALDLLVNQRGFSDDKIRQSQQGTVNQLIRQAETAGQQAGSSLEQPVFKQDVLGAQLQRGFLQDLLGGRGGQDDAISKAERSRFDADAESKRAQLTEDLQRFGILGGNGVSAGAGADVFGKFDAGIAQGGLDIGANQQSRRQSNIENAILPFQQQQNDLRQRQSEFGFGANQSRIGTQQDVADRTLKRLLTATDVTEREQFEQGVQQEGVENTRADTEMFGSQLGSGRKTLATRELEQQATQAGLNREFQGGESALDRDFQGRESAFDRTALRDESVLDRGESALDRALEQERITNQGTQFSSQLLEQQQNRLNSQNAQRGKVFNPTTGKYEQSLDSLKIQQQGEQFQNQLDLQDQSRIDLQNAQRGRVFNPTTGKYEQSLENVRLQQQGEQFDTTSGQEGARIDLQEQNRIDSQNAQRGRVFNPTTGKYEQSLDRLRIDQQGTQFDLDNALRQGELTGRFGGEDTFARDQLDLQNEQFLRGITTQERGQDVQAGIATADRGLDRERFEGSLELDQLRRSDQVNQDQLNREQQNAQFTSGLNQERDRLLGFSYDENGALRNTLARDQLEESKTGRMESTRLEDARRVQDQSRIANQESQFIQSLGLDEKNMSRADRQFFAQLGLQQEELTGEITLDDGSIRSTLAQKGLVDARNRDTESLRLTERAQDIDNTNTDLSRRQQEDQFNDQLGLSRDELIGMTMDENGALRNTIQRDALDQTGSQFDASQLQQDTQFNRGMTLSEEQAKRQAFQEYMANVQGLSQLDNQALGNISTLTGGPAVVSMPAMLDRLGITNPNARPRGNG